ncbi:Protein of unknown function [Gryllus bimaculatus]|nr:Protein of unknown function [Gryllus bimaculatus]
MATSLTGAGVLWAALSLAAALLCCSGFYLPFWIQKYLGHHCFRLQKPFRFILAAHYCYGHYALVRELNVCETTPCLPKPSAYPKRVGSPLAHSDAMGLPGGGGGGSGARVA